MRTGKKAFTLVELLVVISIIALLLAVLIPALSRAKLLAERVVCSGREKDAATGFLAYAAGIGNGRLPIGQMGRNTAGTNIEDETIYLQGRKWSLLSHFAVERWINLKTYIKEGRTLICPAYAKTTDCTSDPNYDGTGPWMPKRATWRAVKFGYNYHGGHFAEKWTVVNPSINSWKSPYRMTDSGSLPLLSDFANEFSSAAGAPFISHGNSGPKKGKYPELLSTIASRGGSNIACLDGSVRWKPIREMKKYYRGKNFAVEVRNIVQPIEDGTGGRYYPYGYW
ncbi:MAG: prepilin-type N-terminal cleavage/methylation domain-containing protein [Phycisphaerales bacterium]